MIPVPTDRLRPILAGLLLLVVGGGCRPEAGELARATREHPVGTPTSVVARLERGSITITERPELEAGRLVVALAAAGRDPAEAERRLADSRMRLTTGADGRLELAPAFAAPGLDGDTVELTLELPSLDGVAIDVTTTFANNAITVFYFLFFCIDYFLFCQLFCRGTVPCCMLTHIGKDHLPSHNLLCRSRRF